MKNKSIIILIVLFLIFCFAILFKGLNINNFYVPNKVFKDKIIKVSADDLNSKQVFSEGDLFVGSDFYILNIWASWCVPCRQEHPKLMYIKKNLPVRIIGLNYKDNKDNAKEFLKELGNPFFKNLVDTSGVISIELGAYGVPETFLINDNKEIIKKFIGPLTNQSIEEIKKIIQ